MSEGRWDVYVRDMLDCCARIEKYTAGLGRDELVGAPARYDAALWNIRVLGEAANHIPDAVQQAHPEIPWADITGIAVRIMPDGLVAASQLGLTNAIPAKVSYLTDGSTRTLKIDGRTGRFRHAGPRVMQWAGKPAAPVVQALRWLGPDMAADPQVVTTLRRRLADEVKRDLWQNSQGLPGWALPLARSITADQAPVV